MAPESPASAGLHHRKKNGRAAAAANKKSQQGATDSRKSSSRPLTSATIAACVAAAGLIVFFLLPLGGRRQPAVTPFAAPKITGLAQLRGQHEQNMLWGTYRPGVYFGMRMRRPQALLAGLMWWDPQLPDFFHNIRHEAQERDGLSKFGWLQHDGTSYGHQELLDTDFNITTTMVKAVGAEGAGAGGDWAVHVRCSHIADAAAQGNEMKRQASFLVITAPNPFSAANS